MLYNMHLDDLCPSTMSENKKMNRELLLMDLEEEEDNEDHTFILAYLRKKKSPRFWVHHLWQERKIYGAFHHLIKSLSNAKFVDYFRLDKELFNRLLNNVRPYLLHTNRAREPIDPEERLCLCLRYLATGESFRSLSFSFRMGRTTVATIVEEVCEAIWECLHEQLVKLPQTPREWNVVAQAFEKRWNFPNCLGSLDGKHVVIQRPSNSGSNYFNYKGTYSLVLLGLVDANKKFLYVDIGSMGKNSDGGVFKNSTLWKAINSGSLNLPPKRKLKGDSDLPELPYVIVADEAFPLTTSIMRPYSGKSGSIDHMVFNYRLSRARLTVENAFGLLCQRWRVYHTKMAIGPKFVRKVVKATICLHNLVQKEIAEIDDDQIDPLELEQNVPDTFMQLQRVGYHGSTEAETIRMHLTNYFVHTNVVNWQHSHVTRGSFE